MATEAPDRVDPWVEAADVSLYVEPLKIDALREHGQIRRLDPAEVKEKYQQLVENPPTGLVKVTVWRVAEDGVSLTCLSLQCAMSLFFF